MAKELDMAGKEALLAEAAWPTQTGRSRPKESTTNKPDYKQNTMRP